MRAFLLGVKNMSDLQAKVDNAIVDMGTVEEFTSADENTDVTSRLGRTYPSLAKAVNTFQTAGGLIGFATKAALDAYTPSAGTQLATVYNDVSTPANNGDYYWSGTAWVKFQKRVTTDNKDVIDITSTAERLSGYAMYADGHFDVAASASMFYVPVKTGDQVTVTSTVGPGSAGTVTAYAFQLDTKRTIISTLFLFTSTGTQQQITYTVTATQAGFIAIRIRTDMTYKILKSEKVFVSPTLMDLSRNSEGGLAAYNPAISLFDTTDFSGSTYETGYVINADGTTSTTTDLTWRNYFIPVEKGDLLEVVATTGGIQMELKYHLLLKWIVIKNYSPTWLNF